MPCLIHDRDGASRVAGCPGSREPTYESRRSVSEEVDYYRGEYVVVLEDSAVPGVGVDDQFGAGDASS